MMARPRGAGSFRTHGFSLVEAIVSIVIVGVAVVAALQAAALSKTALRVQSERSYGRILGEQLMEEILVQSYSQAGDPFGPSVAETAAGNRSLFNDVDDYNRWQESPPQYKYPTIPEKPNSVNMTHLPNWSREVSVAWVSPTDPATVVVSEQGVKRITVTVKFKARVVATLVALRTGKAT